MNVFSIIEKYKEDEIADTIANAGFLANICSTSEGITTLTEFYLAGYDDTSNHYWYLRSSLNNLLNQILYPGDESWRTGISTNEYIEFIRRWISGETWRLAVNNDRFVVKFIMKTEEMYDKVYPTTNNPMSLILAAKANSAWLLSRVLNNDSFDGDGLDKPLDTSEVDKYFGLHTKVEDSNHRLYEKETYKLGRGLTIPIFHINESPFQPNHAPDLE